MNARKWMERVARTTSVNAVAQASGVEQSTLNRQLKSETVTAENVIKIARAYKADVLASLVELRFVSGEEVGAGKLRAVIEEEVKAARLGAMSNEQVTAEMRRLIDEVDRRLTGDDGEPEGEESPGKRTPLGRHPGERVLKVRSSKKG